MHQIGTYNTVNILALLDIYSVLQYSEKLPSILLSILLVATLNLMIL